MLTPLHGGPDAMGVPRHDLSSNGNACGAYPAALHALQRADACHYPDPACTALRCATLSPKARSFRAALPPPAASAAAAEPAEGTSPDDRPRRSSVAWARVRVPVWA